MTAIGSHAKVAARRVYNAAATAVRWGARWSAPSENVWWLRGFWIAQAALIALDIWLVNNGYISISATCWQQAEAHPTILAAALLASIWVAIKMWNFRITVFFWGIEIGHLWTGIPPI